MLFTVGCKCWCALTALVINNRSMSDFAQTMVDDLETAMAVITTALASGKATVKYTMGVGDSRVEHEMTPSDKLLERLSKLHAYWEKRVTPQGAMSDMRFGRNRNY